MPLNPLIGVDTAVRSEELFQGKGQPFELDDILEFPVAVVTDIATSIYNSFVPESLEANTEDILRGVNDDLANFYLNHRQGIELTSFLGGLFIPGLVATKALNLAKAGKLGLASRPFQFFDNRIEKNKRAALKLLSEGQQATTAYIAARRAMIGSAVGQGIIEGVTFEASLALMLQGHPYLEDYDEFDFLIGTSLGVAFVPLKTLWETKTFRDAAQKLEREIGAEFSPNVARSFRPTKAGTSSVGQRIGLQAHFIKWLKDQTQRSDINPQVLEDTNRELIELQARQINDITNLLAPSVRKLVTERKPRTGGPIQLIGEEESVFDADPVGHIARLINVNGGSLEGVESVGLFTNTSPVARDSLNKFGMTRTVFGAEELAQTTDFGLERFEGGKLEDFRKLLGLQKTEDAVEEANKTLKRITGAEFDSLIDGRRITIPGENIDVSISRQEDTYKLTIFDDDRPVFQKSNLRDFLQATSDMIGDDAIRLDIDIRYTREAAAGASRIGRSFDRLSKKSEKISDFLLDAQVADRALTHSQLLGDAPANARDFLVDGNALEGGRLIAVKNINDLNTKNVARITIPDNFKIATREDLAALASEARAANLELGIKPSNQLTDAEIEFLRKKGFHGVEAMMSDRRVTKSLTTVFFEKGIKVAESGVTPEKLRIAGGLPSLEEQFAILASAFSKVISSSEAKLILGAADIDGGYRRNTNYVFNPKTARQLEPEARFLPLRWATHIIDSQYFDAIKALPFKGFFGDLRINPEDLPRLNAVLLRKDLVDKVRFVDNEGKLISTGPLNADGLMDVLKEGKIKWARRLLDRGFSVEQISRYTNTPIDTIEKIIASGFDKGMVEDFSDKAVQWIIYNSQNIDRFLKPKMLRLNGKALDTKDLLRQKQITKSDADLLIQMGRAFVESEAAKGAAFVPAIGQLADLVRSDRFRSLEGNANVFFGKEGLGNITALSRDQAFRRYGQFGEFVTTLSDDIRNIIDNLLSKSDNAPEGAPNGLLDIVTPVFRKIIEDKSGVGIILFNEAFKSIHKVTDDAARNMRYDPTLRKIVLARDKDGNPTEFLKYVGRDGNFRDEDILIEHAAVHEFFASAWPNVQNQLRVMINTNRSIMGKPPIADRGIWIPYNTTEDKFKAYIFNAKDDKATRLIIGNDAADLEEKIAGFRREISDPDIEVVRASDAKRFNEISGYAATEEIRRADATLHSSGILVEGTSTSTRRFDEILNSIQGDVWQHGRTFVRLAGHELFDQLEAFTRAAQRSDNSSARSFFQKASTRVDSATAVSKTLLSQSLLNDNQILSAVNNTYSWAIERAAEKTGDIFRTLRAGSLGATEEDWIRVSKDLERAKMPNPWENWEQFARDQSEPIKRDAKGIIAKINSTFVLLNLRLMETAHAAVTSMTLPVVLSAELASLGGERFPLAYMMRGAKNLFSANPEHVARRKVGLAKGYTTRTTAEVTDVMRKMTSGQGVLDKLEENRMFKALTSPSDWAERVTRELAYSTGYEVALDKFGRGQALEIYESFANAFTKRVMGNYSSRQRPVMFQGTFGATFGLYQTFMLTMGQNIFRYLESKNLKALTTLAGAQSGMFGISALPLFDPISTAIGSYVNNDHADITTTAFELFGNADNNSRSLAEFILFGAPSALLQSAIFTRGELDPRLPFNITTREGIGLLPPALSIIGQLYDSITEAASTVSEIAVVSGSPVDITRALGEAASIQSIWRPGARIAELFTGHSIDRTGKVIDADTEMKADWATFARVLAARPLKEEVLKRLNYNSDYYAAIDQSRRRDSIRALRSLALGDSLDDDSFSKIFQKYIDHGGSLKGFRQVFNEALLSVDNGPAISLLDEGNRNTHIERIFQGYID